MILSLVIMGLSSPVHAEMVTMEDALTVAENWIAVIIHEEGDWGGSGAAYVEEIREFKRGERVLGYSCHVKPQGFMVISLHKELAPVKAYSAVSNLDPESDGGMTDVIKGGMERVLNAIEEQVGPMESVRSEKLGSILEINYRDAWEKIGIDTTIFEQDLESGELEMNYQEGQVLLSSHWHQRDPYNPLCPTGDTGCTDCCPDEPYICSPSFPTLVGCVATAGAQIMNYWSWPPYGVGSDSYNWDGDDSCDGNTGGGALSATFSDYYDWRHMVNQYVWDSGQNRWEDENGNPLTQAHLDAVAELCYEVGVAVQMDYGVCGSSAYTADAPFWTVDMEDAYEDHYRYHEKCHKRDRKDYSAGDWFILLRSEFGTNRPVQYNIPGHSIVADGWLEAGGLQWYHINYGWGWTWLCDGCDMWYAVDCIYGGDPGEEYALVGIKPVPALGSWLSGTYLRAGFPYRYFDRDATGGSATFEAGQNLQFLPEITVTCTSTAGGSIRFKGSSSQSTLLFTRGDRTKGVRIHDSAVRLNRYGSIKFD
jgi:hypothetical protein